MQLLLDIFHYITSVCYVPTYDTKKRFDNFPDEGLTSGNIVAVAIPCTIQYCWQLYYCEEAKLV